MLVRQRRSLLAAAALLDGQEAGVVPIQSSGVGGVEGFVVLPRGSAGGRIAVAMQTCQMLDGTSATVGEQECVVGQRQVVLGEQERLLDGGMAVAVAVEAVGEHR